MASKIFKAPGSAPPSELELEVEQHLKDIETAPGNELKSDLKEFKFAGAKEIECPAGAAGKTPKNAIVMFVPFAVYRESKKCISKLIRELEKKFSKKHVVIVANRTILDKNFRRKGIQVRPRSRTLTAVHEAVLEDVVYPSEITGKRTRIGADGSKLLKIFLDKKDKESVEEKLHVYSAVYKSLTTKDAVFTV